MDEVSSLLAEADSLLAAADARLVHDYPGDAVGRQPVHTIYVPADRFHEDTVDEWRRAALESLELHAPTPAALAEVFQLGDDLAAEVYGRVVEKLHREPVEDLRIDFEDGYGERPDIEEDAAAAAAAQSLRASVTAGTAPPFRGIRVKSFEAATRHRGIRTLAAFLQALLAPEPGERGSSADGVRDGLRRTFVATLPKVTSVDQVQAMVAVCAGLERRLGLAAGSLRFEIQVETPQSVLGPDGTALVAPMLHAAAGRCTALHYGTYDYSAACGVAAAYQSMDHPAADYAKAVMQAAAAGTGVRLSDGSTNVLPVGDPAAVVEAWRLHAGLVRRSLERAFYQGWDLHPAQLPSRYVAVFAFYREGLQQAASRLHAYLAQDDSGFQDEPATARALAGFLLRALDCGAITGAEATASGASPDRLAELARPSFRDP
ncbi:MAG TPA: aldolase [Nocardioidaceae bacterium]|nr:aldolase [Nocardioidaceae bacterium]